VADLKVVLNWGKIPQKLSKCLNFCTAENGKNATFCEVSPVHFECFLKFVKSCTLY
jgi:hypothetical protein